MSLRQIAATVKGISKSSVGRQKKELQNGIKKKTPGKILKTRGRPCKLSARDKREILRCLHKLRNTEGFFYLRSSDGCCWDI